MGLWEDGFDFVNGFVPGTVDLSSVVILCVSGLPRVSVGVAVGAGMDAFNNLFDLRSRFADPVYRGGMWSWTNDGRGTVTLVCKDGVSAPCVSSGLNGVLGSLVVDRWLKCGFGGLCGFVEVFGDGSEVRLCVVAPCDVGGVDVVILERLVEEVCVCKVDLLQGVLYDGVCDLLSGMSSI